MPPPPGPDLGPGGGTKTRLTGAGSPQGRLAGGGHIRVVPR